LTLGTAPFHGGQQNENSPQAAEKSALHLTADEQRWLTAHSEIRLGVDSNYAPFEFVSAENQYLGLAADYIRLLEQRLGIRLTPMTGLSWKETMQKTKDGEIDVLGCVSITKERQRFLAYTKPYLSFPRAIITRDSSRLSTLKELEGYKVAIQKSSALEAFIAERTQLSPILYDTVNGSLRALSHGEVDAVIANLAVATYGIQKMNLTNLKIAAHASNTYSPLAFAVRKDWMPLVGILNKALDSIPETERIKMASRWLPVQQAQEIAAPQFRNPIPNNETSAAASQREFLRMLRMFATVLGLFCLGVWGLLRVTKKHLGNRLLTAGTRVPVVVAMSVFLTAVIAGASLGLQDMEHRARRQIGAMLQTEVQTTNDTLRMWARTNKRHIDELAKDPELLPLVKHLLDVPRDRKSLLASPALTDMRTYFRVRNSQSYGMGFFVIAPDYVSVGSRRDANVGLRNLIADQRPELLKRAFAGETVLVLPVRSDVPIPDASGKLQTAPPTMFVAAPVRDEDGTVIAVITLRGDPQNEFSGLCGTGRTGRSGKTYAFDAAGILLSHSHPEAASSQAKLLCKTQQTCLDICICDPGVNLVKGEQPSLPLEQLSLTRMAAAATAGQTGLDVQGYRDYRGVTVLGAWTWDAELGLGLATEIDESEAMTDYRHNRRLLLLLLGATVLLALLLTTFAIWSDGRATRTLRQARDRWEQLAEQRTAELRQREKKLHAIFEQTNQLMGMLDTEGNLLEANCRAMAFCASAQSELIGKPFWQCPWWNHSCELQQQLRDAIDQAKTGQVVSFEALHPTPEAEQRNMEVTLSPVTDNDGQVMFLLAMGHDITSRKQVEEQLRKLSSAVEQSPLTVVITDTRGNIDYVNPRFTEMTGYTAKEAIGQNTRIMKAEGKQSAEFYADLWHTIKAGHQWHGEFCNRRRDGSLFWEAASISPVRDEAGVVTHYVAIKEDITRRKQLEKELLEAKEQAEAATQAKSDFLANMSHEIRTPMNGIIGMTHLALQTPLTPKQEDYLQKVDASANSLLRVINDILDFSKIEAGKLDLEAIDFDLDDVLAKAVNLIAINAQDKGLELLLKRHPQVPCKLQGDPLRLGQILANLANNAVKFTDEGEIVISVEIERQEEHSLRLKFAVRDTGIGLGIKEIQNLFRSFSQVDTSTTRRYGGTGLGLSICQSLVELMNGKIWVESERGRGSTFFFTAVFGLADDQEHAALSPHPDLRGVRVLVVDDNATSRQVFEDMLASMSLNVTLAASGQEALTNLEQAAKTAPFKLLLLDQVMPGMDGVQLAEHIAADPRRYGSPKLIMLTTDERETNRAETETLNLNAILSKPVTQSSLLDALMRSFDKVADQKARHRKKPTHAGLESIRGAQILLVEDNEINQQVAREILEQGGLQVSIANNGLDAVQAVSQKHYDAILMDVQMPVMDGLQATRHIRAWENSAKNPRAEAKHRLPIIAMTAHAMTGDAEKSLEAGMNDHVTKPIDPTQLFQALLKWTRPQPERPKTPPPPAARIDKEPGNTLLPEQLPGLDLADGLRRLGGNHQLYTQILHKFRAGYAQTDLEIRRLMADGKKEDAQRLAHTLKGLAGNIGAGNLQAASAALETGMKNDESDALDRLLPCLTAELDTVIRGLEVLTPEQQDAHLNDGEAATPGQLLDALGTLQAHLKSRKPKPCKAAIEQLSGMVLPQSLAPAVAHIGRLVGKYKFMEAVRVLEPLLADLAEAPSPTSTEATPKLTS
jgi:polar amino acid transport system substrate-binding protein